MLQHLSRAESLLSTRGMFTSNLPAAAQELIPPQFKVEKVFPQRGYLCLHRLVKRATFTCNRCGLGKTSKPVAFAKDKWDEPMCNGCYGYLLSDLEKQGEAL
jgi:hypothetical protein